MERSVSHCNRFEYHCVLARDIDAGVPLGRVEKRALEVLPALNIAVPGYAQSTRTVDQDSRCHETPFVLPNVAVLHPPVGLFLDPGGLHYLSSEISKAMQTVCVGDFLEVRLHLGLFSHEMIPVLPLVEGEGIETRRDIACCSRVDIVGPSSAETSATLEEFDTRETELALELARSCNTGRTGADDDCFVFGGHGL